MIVATGRVCDCPSALVNCFSQCYGTFVNISPRLAETFAEPCRDEVVYGKCVLYGYKDADQGADLMPHETLPFSWSLLLIDTPLPFCCFLVFFHFGHEGGITCASLPRLWCIKIHLRDSNPYSYFT